MFTTEMKLKSRASSFYIKLFKDDVTFSHIIWKWSRYSCVGHNPNLNGTEGFFSGWVQKAVYL